MTPPGAEAKGLFGVDFQADVKLRTIVKLTDGFGAALAVVVLRIHFVIDAGLKSREAIGAVWANDIGFYGAGVSVGQVNDRVRQRIVTGIQHLASEHAGLFFLLSTATLRGPRVQDTPPG